MNLVDVVPELTFLRPFICLQGWFVNMFELDTIDAETHAVRFATAESRGWTHPKGGWQGGRGWQIGNASQINDTDATNYLTGGKWMVENFWEALDVNTAHLLFFYF